MDIGRNECTALASLLQSTANLQELKLGVVTEIDDEGIGSLMGALHWGKLRVLAFSNGNITARGCQSLANLLECLNSNLEELGIANNNIGDEGALIFANALATNRKLKTLALHGNGTTTEGLSCFSKVLCDTSSINKTFLSNHTLNWISLSNLPPDVRASLRLNRSEDKKKVAIRKILQHHQLDMQPFFEWDLKVLPLAVKWFERAGSIGRDGYIESIDVVEVGKRKLEAVYQFIRAMPEVFEPAPAAGDKRKRSAGGVRA